MAESEQTVDVLVKLKSAVLNVDWEISDETLAELNQEVVKLQGEWRGQKVHLVYLQILGALCQYIGSSREKSHPRTFILLKEVFDGLEELVANPEAEQAEKNKNVMAFAGRYHQLKEEIVSGDFVPGPPKEEEEEKSTMDKLMEDEEDHSTDTVFDSMLNAMVQAPTDEEDESESSFEENSEPESRPEPEPVAAPSPSRPPVQAAFSKADGTEVEPDRNEDDEFTEADDLLDDFFEDDDIPAPGGGDGSDDAIFDLNELAEDDAPADDLELTSDDTPDDEGELVLHLDDDEEDDSFQEMEETLDDFFGEDENENVSKEQGEDDALIDEALDDFFEDDTVTSTEDEPELLIEDDGEDLQVEEVRDDTDDDMGEGSLEDGDDITVDIDEPEGEDEAEPSLVIPVNEVATESVMEDADPELDSEPEPEPDLVTESDPDPESELELEEPEPADAVPDASCVENLQMLLLSVEWEVDDKLLLRLQEEVESLQVLLEDNHTAGLHLRLLTRVISYVGREQAEVISDSMICLKLIADSLEGLMAPAADSARCGLDAVASFMDWHELVVLDFEKRLARISEPSGSESTVLAEQAEEAAPQITGELSEEMQGLKDSILQEVRTLIAKEVAELKG